MAQSGSMVLAGRIAGQERDRRRLRCILINITVGREYGIVEVERLSTCMDNRCT